MKSLIFWTIPGPCLDLVEASYHQSHLPHPRAFKSSHNIPTGLLNINHVISDFQNHSRAMVAIFKAESIWSEGHFQRLFYFWSHARTMFGPCESHFLPQLAGRLHRAQHFYRKYLVMLFCLPKSLYMLPLGIFSLRSVNTSTFLFPLPKLLWTWVISKARSNFFYKITQKINLLVFNCTYWAKNMCYHHTKCKDKCFSLIKLSLPWTSFTWKNIVLCISAIYSDIMWVREVRSDHNGARFCHQSPRIYWLLFCNPWQSIST